MLRSLFKQREHFFGLGKISKKWEYIKWKQEVENIHRKWEVCRQNGRIGINAAIELKETDVRKAVKRRYS